LFNIAEWFLYKNLIGDAYTLTLFLHKQPDNYWEWQKPFFEKFADQLHAVLSVEQAQALESAPQPQTFSAWFDNLAEHLHV
jgi:hypothetical protein